MAKITKNNKPTMHQETKDDHLEIIVLFQINSANLSLATTVKAFLMGQKHLLQNIYQETENNRMNILQRFITTKIRQKKQEEKHMMPAHQIVNSQIAVNDTDEHK